MFRNRFLTWAMIGLVAAGCVASPAQPTPTPSPWPTPYTQRATDTPQPINITASGQWLGGFIRADGSAVSLLIDFKTENGATLTVEPQVKTWPLESVEQSGAEVRFSVTGQTKSDFQHLQFTGSLQNSNGNLLGEMDWDGETHTIDFVALAENPAFSPADLTGLYQFPSGRVVSILPAPELTRSGLRFYAPGLTFTDFESGARRGLYPLSAPFPTSGEAAFALGGARAVGFPFSAQLGFQPDPSKDSLRLTWQTIDPATHQINPEYEVAESIAFGTEDVQYASTDGISLAGRLTLLPGPGPHPALVMLHGSERGQRDGLGQQLMAHFLASQGIALLTYDKRGVGGSGGTYRESADAANLQLQAQDALAGVEFLLTRSEIDSARIGLIGGSQAGWIIPIAAESDHVAFFVILSGPVVSVGQEDFYSAFANDGESPPSMSAEEISAQLAAFPPSGFDPLPAIAALDQPGLWLWGGQDKSVPVPESEANLKQLIESGKRNFSYVIFPDADHSLSISKTGLLAEIPYSSGLVYYTALTNWIQQHVLSVSSNTPSPSSPSATPVDLGTAFVVKYADTATVRLENSQTLEIQFLLLLEDSRCPSASEVMCVWAGNVKVMIRVWAPGVPYKDFELNTNSGVPGEVDHLQYRITLLDVHPPAAKFSSQLPDEAYSLELTVTESSP